MAELDERVWPGASAALQAWCAPWIRSVAPGTWARSVSRLERLDATFLVGAHVPVVSGPQIATALGVLRELPRAVRARG